MWDILARQMGLADDDAEFKATMDAERHVHLVIECSGFRNNPRFATTIFDLRSGTPMTLCDTCTRLLTSETVVHVLHVELQEGRLVDVVMRRQAADRLP
jgi:hypothetical protein